MLLQPSKQDKGINLPMHAADWINIFCQRYSTGVILVVKLTLQLMRL